MCDLIGHLKSVLMEAVLEYKEVRAEVSDPEYLNGYMGRLLTADPFNTQGLYHLFEVLSHE